MFEEKIKCSFSQRTAEIVWVLNVNVNCGSFPPAWKTTKTFLTFLLNKVLLGLHKKCHTRAMDHHSYVMFMHAKKHHLLHSTYSDLVLLLSLCILILLYIWCLIYITLHRNCPYKFYKILKAFCTFFHSEQSWKSIDDR